MDLKQSIYFVGMRYGFRGVVADPEENEMEDLTELGKDDFEEELGGK